MQVQQNYDNLVLDARYIYWKWKHAFFINQDSKPEYLQRGTKLSDESEVTHQIIFKCCRKTTSTFISPCSIELMRAIFFCYQEIPNVLTHLKEGKLKKIEKCFVGISIHGIPHE